MTTSLGIGLARVTIAAPRRRIDVALPEHVPLAQLLARLLQHTGESTADDGEAHGGWVLRRADGAALETGKSLNAQQVRDGEILYLAPRRVEWPELEFDDVVDAIATGARKYGLAWTKKATRIGGLTVAAVVLALGLVVVLMSGPDWFAPGLASLIIGGVLIVIGILLSRALSDGGAAAVLASMGLLYAFVGGGLVLGFEDSLRDLGAPHLLTAAASLLAASVIGYIGVGDYGRMFVAGAMVALFTGTGALLGFSSMDQSGVAALLLAVVLPLVPAFPVLAMRMGKLPIPILPERPEDLLRDEPMPPRSTVYSAVIRSDEILTGMLFGIAAVSVVCEAILILGGGLAGPLLGGVVSGAYLLRTRLFPTVRQRLPLLVAGLVGLGMLAMQMTMDYSPTTRLFAVVSIMVALAGLIATAGINYSRRAPSPYVGRIADILDALLVMSVLPIAAQVLGLYGYVRGLNG